MTLKCFVPLGLCLVFLVQCKASRENSEPKDLVVGSPNEFTLYWGFCGTIHRKPTIICRGKCEDYDPNLPWDERRKRCQKDLQARTIKNLKESAEQIESESPDVQPGDYVRSAPTKRLVGDALTVKKVICDRDELKYSRHEDILAILKRTFDDSPSGASTHPVFEKPEDDQVERCIKSRESPITLSETRTWKQDPGRTHTSGRPRSKSATSTSAGATADSYTCQTDCKFTTVKELGYRGSIHKTETNDVRKKVGPVTVNSLESGWAELKTRCEEQAKEYKWDKSRGDTITRKSTRDIELVGTVREACRSNQSNFNNANGKPYTCHASCKFKATKTLGYNGEIESRNSRVVREKVGPVTVDSPEEGWRSLQSRCDSMASDYAWNKSRGKVITRLDTSGAQLEGSVHDVCFQP